jgi:hypothetical protein
MEATMGEPSKPTIGRATSKQRAATGVAVSEVPTLAEAKKPVDLNGPFNDAKGADGVGPERDFSLDYTDERGRRWAGDFKMRVLTMKDRVQVGLTRSRLAAGVPFAMLDGQTAMNLEVLAHLAVALVSSPPWAKDLMAIYDPNVLGAIYEEVAAHEVRFHTPEQPEAGVVDGDEPG